MIELSTKVTVDYSFLHKMLVQSAYQYHEVGSFEHQGIKDTELFVSDTVDLVCDAIGLPPCGGLRHPEKFCRDYVTDRWSLACDAVKVDRAKAQEVALTFLEWLISEAALYGNRN